MDLNRRESPRTVWEYTYLKGHRTYWVIAGGDHPVPLVLNGGQLHLVQGELDLTLHLADMYNMLDMRPEFIPAESWRAGICRGMPVFRDPDIPVVSRPEWSDIAFNPDVDVRALQIRLRKEFLER